MGFGLRGGRGVSQPRGDPVPWCPPPRDRASLWCPPPSVSISPWQTLPRVRMSPGGPHAGHPPRAAPQHQDNPLGPRCPPWSPLPGASTPSLGRGCPLGVSMASPAWGQGIPRESLWHPQRGTRMSPEGAHGVPHIGMMASARHLPCHPPPYRIVPMVSPNQDQGVPSGRGTRKWPRAPGGGRCHPILHGCRRPCGVPPFQCPMQPSCCCSALLWPLTCLGAPQKPTPTLQI